MKQVSTEKKIEEGNRLIMFFDGAENTVIDIMGDQAKAIKYKGEYYPDWNLPKFHEDWNLLMPVVKMIDLVWWTDFDKPDFDEEELAEEKQKVFDLSINNPIKTVWNAVVDFITWYNEKQPSNAANQTRIHKT